MMPPTFERLLLPLRAISGVLACLVLVSLWQSAALAFLPGTLQAPHLLSSSPSPKQDPAKKFVFGSDATVRPSFAGSSSPPWSMIAAALAVTACAGRAALIRRFSARGKITKNGWWLRKHRAEITLVRNPPKRLSTGAMAQRQYQARAAKLYDYEMTIKPYFLDPRGTDWQMPAKQFRTMLDNPEYKLIEDKRAELGLPAPPWSCYEQAMEELQKAGASGGMDAPEVIETGDMKLTPAEMTKEYIRQKGYKRARTKIRSKDKGKRR